MGPLQPLVRPFHIVKVFFEAFRSQIVVKINIKITAQVVGNVNVFTTKYNDILIQKKLN